MPKSDTHNEIILQPPPGTRFAIWGSSVHLEFPRGKEEEIYNWLKSVLDTQISTEVTQHRKTQEVKAKAQDIVDTSKYICSQCGSKHDEHKGPCTNGGMHNWVIETQGAKGSEDGKKINNLESLKHLIDRIHPVPKKEDNHG